MKPIQICYFTREYAHKRMGSTGGIGVFVKQLTTELKTHDFQITVFSFGNEAVSFDDGGVRVVKIKDLSHFNAQVRRVLQKYQVPGYHKLKLFLAFLNRVYISLYLSVFVFKHRFDMVEFHDYGGDAPYFLGRLKKVIRCHGSAVALHQFMGYGKRQTDTVFEYQMFKRFKKHVIAVSDYSAQMAQEAFQLKVRPQTIYNGVVLDRSVIQSSYLHAPTIPFSVFYFGSLRERKGIDIACETFNKVVIDFPNAQFHIMGANNNDYWNNKVVHVLSEVALAQTRYHGMVPNAEIVPYLQQAHVVLFPSYGENFSVALLEVMALKKLVICSDIPAFAEIIKHGENGLIANSNLDYPNLIKSIFENDIDIEKISSNAVDTIKNNFEMQIIINQNINYYKSLL
ncbi:glycosyltransferase family 4 protein [Xanthomarina sp. F2636L]|uniref:glycosyltransferase family 4 protein n=1 Tax=Xanthomarina sp. F2636L TaxID=2996018 RepID=UPI00225E1840|nr:glycosyltransferase family 4 protein [Xanthomarina sp. F2636L]MCX7549369.1 glycosyltransferase family 4 protein [Xanthomarina sp. F2636L]